MKLVRDPRPDDPLSEIKRRFAEFNKSSSPSKGRRYPPELKELVQSAGAQGHESATLCRLTGLSSSAANRWLAAAAPRPVAARRLAVVDASANSPHAPPAPVVVRLPSGVTIELSDSRSLSGAMLAALGLLEVRDAASR